MAGPLTAPLDERTDPDLVWLAGMVSALIGPFDSVRSDMLACEIVFCTKDGRTGRIDQLGLRSRDWRLVHDAVLCAACGNVSPDAGSPYASQLAYHDRPGHIARRGVCKSCLENEPDMGRLQFLIGQRDEQLGAKLSEEFPESKRRETYEEWQERMKRDGPFANQRTTRECVAAETSAASMLPREKPKLAWAAVKSWSGWCYPCKRGFHHGESVIDCPQCGATLQRERPLTKAIGDAALAIQKTRADLLERFIQTAQQHGALGIRCNVEVKRRRVIVWLDGGRDWREKGRVPTLGLAEDPALRESCKQDMQRMLPARVDLDLRIIDVIAEDAWRNHCNRWGPAAFDPVRVEDFVKDAARKVGQVETVTRFVEAGFLDAGEIKRVVAEKLLAQLEDGLVKQIAQAVITLPPGAKVEFRPYIETTVGWDPDKVDEADRAIIEQIVGKGNP